MLLTSPSGRSGRWTSSKNNSIYFESKYERREPELASQGNLGFFSLSCNIYFLESLLLLASNHLSV